MHYSTEVTDSNFSDGQKFGKPSSATATKSFMQSSSVIASKVCFGQSPRQYVLRLAGRTLATKVTSGKEDAESPSRAMSATVVHQVFAKIRHLIHREATVYARGDERARRCAWNKRISEQASAERG